MRTHDEVPPTVRRRAKARAAALVASAVVAAQLGASAAVAAPTASILTDPVVAAFVGEVGMESIENQEALMQLRSWMIEQPGFAGSGYVGSIDDLPNKATTVMWHGSRTPLLAAIIAEGASRGIRVSVQPRRHSLEQLQAATEAIWRQKAAGGWAGFDIASIEAVGAVEGLTVTGSYVSSPMRGSTSAAASVASAVSRPSAVSLPTAVEGIPVRIKPGEAATAQLGRGNDVSPFYAGGYMFSPLTNGICSNGFAVKIGGVARTTTARHCPANDYQSRDASGAQHQYGQGIATSSHGVRALSKPGSPAMFRYGWDASSWVTVRTFAPLAINSMVCTSGGNSGQHCNIKVSNLNVSWNDGFGVIWTVRGDQQAPGAITSMEGDSGGPVFTIAPNGARAAGMIQAGAGTRMVGNACGPAHDHGVPVRGGAALECSTSVLFTPISAMLTGLNAQLYIA